MPAVLLDKKTNMNKELVIAGGSELDVLLYSGKRFRSLKVRITHFSEQENNYWEQRVRKVYFACGCETGAFFVFVAILVVFSYLLLFYAEVASAPLWYLGRIGMLLFASGAVGKVVGIANAKYKLHEAVDALRKRL